MVCVRFERMCVCPGGETECPLLLNPLGTSWDSARQETDLGTCGTDPEEGLESSVGQGVRTGQTSHRRDYGIA